VRERVRVYITLSGSIINHWRSIAIVGFDLRPRKGRLINFLPAITDCRARVLKINDIGNHEPEVWTNAWLGREGEHYPISWFMYPVVKDCHESFKITSIAHWNTGGKIIELLTVYI